MAAQYRLPWIAADEPVTHQIWARKEKPSVNRGFYQSYLLMTSQEGLWAFPLDYQLN